jgi:phosphoribosylaminoimidazole carboxylase PurE protein
MTWVLIVMGSDSDMPVMSEAANALEDLRVPYTITVASAHRTPERTKQIVTDAENDGCAVFIAGAGMAAHLPGVVAAYTTRPVIGVPLASGAMQGTDALYAIVQMPPGIPVATVAIGGARNAGILAAQMIATGDDALAARLKEKRAAMADAVIEKAKKVTRSTR